MKYLTQYEERDPDKEDLNKEFAAYRKHLAKLESRLSAKTWDYFWNGFGAASIHDARLIALSVGDGLEQIPRRDRANPVRIRAEFLNQSGEYRFIFEYREIRKFEFAFDATVGQWLYELPGGKKVFDAKHYLRRKELNDVMGDELTASDKEYLRHEFVFVSGAHIVVEAAEISFQRKRIALAKPRKSTGKRLK